MEGPTHDHWCEVETEGPTGWTHDHWCEVETEGPTHDHWCEVETEGPTHDHWCEGEVSLDANVRFAAVRTAYTHKNIDKKYISIYAKRDLKTGTGIELLGYCGKAYKWSQDETTPTNALITTDDAHVTTT